jgi:hypothetical protein
VKTYLDRYLAGEHERVWEELTSLGDQVRDEPTCCDALAVARETMRRVRLNIELLVSRLTRLRYQFGYDHLRAEADWARRQPKVFVPARQLAADMLSAFEKRIGTLPLSLYAWYETVEEVSFVGRAPHSCGHFRFNPDVFRWYAGDEPWQLSLALLTFITEHPELLASTPEYLQSWLDPLQITPLHVQFKLFGDWQAEKA